VSDSPTLVIEAPAKINLFLSVVGRRPDGYHLLESLMVKLALSDQLTFRRRASSGIDLDVEPPMAGAIDDNLVYKAAARFFDRSLIKGGVTIGLRKRIPVAAGLGGGSSDAAATLLALNHLYDSPFSLDELMALGLELGADVPFFLYPHETAFVSGIGEHLRPGPPLSGLALLLVNPGWPLSTAWVFKNYKLKLTTRRRNSIFSALHERSFTIDQDPVNDLESVVLPRYPELRHIKDALCAAGAVQTLMSGSGPTVFGRFAGERDRDPAGEKLVRAGRGRWLVWATTNRDPAMVEIANGESWKRACGKRNNGLE
jgi:4-diphosphocytidyl-2-C-methyl-D-erythritol kinase